MEGSVACQCEAILTCGRIDLRIENKVPKLTLIKAIH